MIVYWMIGHAFPHVRVNLITSTWIDVRLSLWPWLVWSSRNCHACLILWDWVVTCIGHLAVTKFSQLFEVTPLIPVVNSLQWSCPVSSRYIVTSFVLRGRLFTHEFVPVSICVDNGPHTLPQGVGHYTWHNLDIYILN